MHVADAVLHMFDLDVTHGAPIPRRVARLPGLRQIAYLPAEEYASARERGLLDPTVQRDHLNYRREVQRALERTSTAGTPIAVMPIDVTGLMAFAEREGVDPTRRDTRLRYCRWLTGSGRARPWPPPRNAPCWCGSGAKYKRCCGGPGFTSVELPDPAIMILRIELDHVRPRVWRRVAAPSNMNLDAFQRVIQRAMGEAVCTCTPSTTTITGTSIRGALRPGT